MEKDQRKESRFKKFVRENTEEVFLISLGIGLVLIPAIFLGITSSIESKRKYRFLEKALEKGAKVIEIKPNEEISDAIK